MDFCYSEATRVDVAVTVDALQLESYRYKPNRHYSKRFSQDYIKMSRQCPTRLRKFHSLKYSARFCWSKTHPYTAIKPNYASICGGWRLLATMNLASRVIQSRKILVNKASFCPKLSDPNSPATIVVQTSLRVEKH